MFMPLWKHFICIGPEIFENDHCQCSLIIGRLFSQFGIDVPLQVRPRDKILMCDVKRLMPKAENDTTNVKNFIPISLGLGNLLLTLEIKIPTKKRRVPLALGPLSRFQSENNNDTCLALCAWSVLTELLGDPNMVIVIYIWNTHWEWSLGLVYVCLIVIEN